MKRFSILAIFLLILIGISITFCEASTNTSTNINVNGKDEFVDSPTTDLSQFFKERKRIYHIQYDHTTRDSIILPDSCILSFEGGSIAAPIVFNDTRLSGQIKLQGSSISGSISNSVFDASWLCYRDEKRDDANNINQIISVSDNIFFPDGDYYLESLAMPSKDVSTTLHSELKCHIGIHRSNVHLYGDKNTRFVSTTPIVMICAYSCPYQIDNSISNLQFQNIRFSEKNDKLNFHEFAHTLKLIGINNCTISDCVFDDFWGDAITLGHYGDNVKTGERTRNQNIKIYNNIIRGEGYNNRNAISVISGKNVSISGNTIEHVSSKNMPGAIDIEANNAAYTIDDITISWNNITDSNGGLGAICIVSQNNAPAHNIQIDHNTIKDSRFGLCLVINSDDCVSNVSIVSNVIDDNTTPYKYIGSSRTQNWVIKDNVTKFKNQKFGGNIKFSNLFFSVPE